MNTFTFSARACPGSRGFSMVELMVALVVGLFLIGAMITVLMTSSSTGKSRERASDLQNNGRFALELMKRDIQHAGFRGYTSVLDPDAAVTVAAVTNVCNAAEFGLLSLRVFSVDKDNPYKTTCIPQAIYENNTDVLVVRHVSPNPVSGAFKSDVIYFRSAYEGGVFFLGNAPPVSSDPKVWSAGKLWTDAVDYQLEESVYFISKCTTLVTDGNNTRCASGEDPKIPALYRVKLTNGPKMDYELVASGIENLQVRVRANLSLIAASYFKPTVSTVWANVNALEVSLLAVSSAAEAGYKNKETIVMGDAEVKLKNDGFRRDLFTTVIFLRNN